MCRCSCLWSVTQGCPICPNAGRLWRRCCSAATMTRMTHRVTLEYHGIFSSLDWQELFLALLRFEAKPESSSLSWWPYITLHFLSNGVRTFVIFLNFLNFHCLEVWLGIWLVLLNFGFIPWPDSGWLWKRIQSCPQFGWVGCFKHVLFSKRRGTKVRRAVQLRFAAGQLL